VRPGWGICAAALVSVALIVFMLQNTRSVEVSFLWLHGTLPLALALLIAAVGSAILTMVAGTARISQLRRLARRRRDQQPRLDSRSPPPWCADEHFVAGRGDRDVGLVCAC